MSNLPRMDEVTGEVMPDAPVGCERCKAEHQRAEAIHRDLLAAEASLRRERSRGQALENELRRQREDQPDAPVIRRLLKLWRDEVKGGSTRVDVGLSGPRAQRVAWAVKRYGEERVAVAIRNTVLDDWAMGRDPRTKGRPYNDIAKHILKDEETVERFEALGDRVEQKRRSALSLEDVTDRLEGVQAAGPAKFNARCPAHDDRHASLVVSQGDKGVVMRCHAGCQFGEITDALGIDQGALFAPDDGPIVGLAPPERRVAAPSPEPSTPLPSQADLEAFMKRLAGNEKLLGRLKELRGWSVKAIVDLLVGFDGERLTFPVRDAEGRLVNVMRYRPGGAKPKMLPWGPGLPRDLFPAPESFDGDELVVVEGEADAVTAAELGLPGVAVPGANGWKAEWAARFVGRRVVLCADCDEPGRKLARRIAEDLVASAAEVRVLDLAPDRADGFDLTDAAMEGATADVLRALAAEAPPVDWREREEAAA